VPNQLKLHYFEVYATERDLIFCLIMFCEETYSKVCKSAFEVYQCIPMYIVYEYLRYRRE